MRKNLRKNRFKRATIVISFTWILVALIGMFLLYISGNVIEKYKAYSEKKTEIEYKKAIDALFRDISNNVDVSENKIYPVNNIFSGKKIIPHCIDNITYLQVGSYFDKNSKVFQAHPVVTYSFQAEPADNVYLATMIYKSPFIISNLFIIISPRTLVIIDNSTNQDFLQNFQFSSFSNKILLKVVDLKKYSINEINNLVVSRNLKRVDIVTENTNFDANNLKNIKTVAYLYHYNFNKILTYKNLRGYIVTLNLTGQDGTNHKYTFFDYGDDFALTKALLFSEPSNIECVFHMLNKNMLLSYKFLRKKTQEILKNINISNNFCIDYTGTILEEKDLYDNINQTTKSIISKINSSSFFSIDDKNNFEEVLPYLDDLIKENNNLNIHDCLTVY